MGSGAEKASWIATVADDNLVDNVLDPRTVRPNNGNQGNAIVKALLNESVEKRFVGNWRVQDDFTGKRHGYSLAVPTTAFHPISAIQYGRYTGRPG